MTSTCEWIHRRLARAVLVVPNRVAVLGLAVWLYLYLLAEAGHQGRICRQTSRIATDLGVPETEVEAWVSTLVASSLVTVLSPSPYLVMKLSLWPGKASNQAVVPSESQGSHGNEAIEAISNHGEVGGQGEGEGLLQEILKTLDESDPAPFRKALDHFTPAVIRQALDRVRAAKPGQIRKSKTAYFRFLLGRLSKPASP